MPGARAWNGSVAVVIDGNERDSSKDIKLEEMERKTGRHGLMEHGAWEMRKSLDEPIWDVLQVEDVLGSHEGVRRRHLVDRSELAVVRAVFFTLAQFLLSWGPQTCRCRHR
jgi:hypothetical protein